jgi:HPt (histidine-containing phosphotransfer) domain-containing protein
MQDAENAVTKTGLLMSEKSESTADKIEAMLLVMWKSSRPTVAERIGTLRNAQERLAEGALDRITRKDAESAAHKLAGVLGTFGIPQGSALSSKIESLLAQDAGINQRQQQELASWLDDLEGLIATKDENVKSNTA